MTASSQSRSALMRRKKADLVEEVVALRAALESERDIGPTDVAQERGSLPGEELFTGEDRAGLWPMIDSSPVGVSIIRPDGMILYINSALAELVGVEQHEVVGKDTQVLFFDPADRDPFLAKIERDGGIEGLERQIQRSDGEEFWISLTTRIHQMNGQEVWVTWAHDVTDEHRQTEKLRDLLDTVPCTVVVSSAETSELLFVNEFAHETTGLRVGGASSHKPTRIRKTEISLSRSCGAMVASTTSRSRSMHGMAAITLIGSVYLHG